MGSSVRAMWVVLRLLVIFLLLLLFSLGFYYFELLLDSRFGTLFSISFAILFALPFSVGALATFLLAPNCRRSSAIYYVVPALLVFGILIIGGLVLREGVICLILLAPLWLMSSYLGAFVVKEIFDRFEKRTGLKCSMLALAPVLILALESHQPQVPREFQVVRVIEIEATPDEIWPHLLSMDDISPNEGRWNLTQNVLGIPRPHSAVTISVNQEKIRYAQWGENITFEEKIVSEKLNTQLGWEFIFPNDSVQRYTDRHISPDGPHLKIMTGQYHLSEIGQHTTRLTLETTYLVRTPVNYYSALWGQLILGDIQRNILQIAKERSEA
ncbi:hypothetical protein ABFZ85_11890 [Hyphococcus formosus]|uniref:hypothetical protein n=1 Tax=Hyphococcus formosus TaxID=3143534 RepID=UPI00398B01D0